MEATSGVMEGLLSVPDSGGSLRGLGERFQPDLLRGTGNFSVPIPLAKGPNGQAPSLSLRYSTGNGRSAFGLGWQLAGPLQSTRSADKRLPRYDDSDEFTLSGADTLVPVGGGRYRPRSDTQFWKIVRDGAGWQVQNKQGCVYRLGSAEGSRTFDGSRIHAWHVDQETDCAGNAIAYSYERDGGALGKMLLPFRLGLGGPIGDGKQWMPWIDREDVLRAIEWAIDHESAPVFLAPTDLSWNSVLSDWPVARTRASSR